MRKQINIKTALTFVVGTAAMEHSLLAVDMPQQFSNEDLQGPRLDPQNPMRNEHLQADPLQQQVQPNVAGTPKQLAKALKIANAQRVKEERKQNGIQKALNRVQLKAEAKAQKVAKAEARKLAKAIRAEDKRLAKVLAKAEKVARAEVKKVAKRAQAEVKRLAKIAAQVKKAAKAFAKKQAKAQPRGKLRTQQSAAPQAVLATQQSAAAQAALADQQAATPQAVLAEQQAVAAQDALAEQQAVAAQDALADQQAAAAQVVLAEPQTAAAQDALAEQQTAAAQDALAEQQAAALQLQVFRQAPPNQETLNDYGIYYIYSADTPLSHNGPSLIYNLNFPKAPVFHQYNIDENMRTTDGVTPVPFRAPLFLRLPSTQIDRWPAVLGAYIPENMPRENIDLMVMVQNMPWEQGTPILYRPHYYLEPNAPYFGTYNHNQAVTAQCVPHVGHAVSFSKQDMVAATHPQGAAGLHSQILLSGAAPDSIVLNGVDNQHSSSFFSIFRSGDRLAITLHALLNDADHNALEAQLAAQRYGNLTEIQEGPLNNLAGNQIFQSLNAIIG